jgi:prepilin-type N-terminal cleavage/methylation domain-containing protein
MYQRRGFTLIELLVVIAIIGILATMVITSLLVARTKAYNATAQSDVTEMNKGVQLFENDDTNPAQGAPVLYYNSSDNNTFFTVGSNTAYRETLTGSTNCSGSSLFASPQAFCYTFSGTMSTTTAQVATAITHTATGSATTGGISYGITTYGGAATVPSTSGAGITTTGSSTHYMVYTNLLAVGSQAASYLLYLNGSQYTQAADPTSSGHIITGF